MQLTGLIAKTGADEDRMTCRAISVASIIRRFNQWVIEVRNKSKAEEGSDDKVARVQGSNRSLTSLIISVAGPRRPKRQESSLEKMS